MRMNYLSEVVAPQTILDAGTMQGTQRKLVAAPFSIETSPRQPFELVFSYVPHVLRLQLLRAQLPTHVQSTLPCSDLLIPRTQVEQRPVVFAKGSPHQPPAVGRVFQHSTVRTGAAVERIGDRNR